MTTDPTATQTPQHAATPEVAEPAVNPSTNPFLDGNPALVGLPVFISASVALGLVLIGYVPAAAVGASLPIIIASAGLGLTISTIWAAATGQSAVASIFGIFAGFWLSYAVLVLGLTHSWFGITEDAVAHTQALFLITWLVIIVLLTVATLRLPLAFTAIFVFVDLALAAVLISTLTGTTVWSKIGGILAFLFAATGAYVYIGVTSQATGGRAIALGRPVLGS